MTALATLARLHPRVRPGLIPIAARVASKRMTVDNKQVATKCLGSQPCTAPLAEEENRESQQKASRHGLTAEWMLLEGEDTDRFQALCEDLYAEYHPTTRIEECWVRYLAAALWRLGRAPVFEAAVLEWSRQCVHDAHDHGHAPQGCTCPAALAQPQQNGLNAQARTLWGRALNIAVTRGGHLTKLARHEGHLLNQIERTLKLLQNCRGRGEKQGI